MPGEILATGELISEEYFASEEIMLGVPLLSEEIITQELYFIKNKLRQKKVNCIFF